MNNKNTKNQLERFKTFLILNKLDKRNPHLFEGLKQVMGELNICDNPTCDGKTCKTCCSHEFDVNEGNYCLDCGLHRSDYPR